jgi:two-component system LytT family response regulator
MIPSEAIKDDIVSINTHKQRIAVPVNAIVYIRAVSNYSYIILKNGKHIFTSKTLKYWSNRVNISNFVAANRTYLVHKEAIDCCCLDGSIYKIQLLNGESIYSSRRKKNLVQKFIQ